MRTFALAFSIAALAVTGLSAQETPPPNRVAWLSILPEPLPEGVNQLALEATSQFLRPFSERSDDGRTFARLDGEEWQLTGDWAMGLGPGRINLRMRLVDRSGGIADQAILNWHKLLNTPGGGREDAPRWRLAYHLERDGVLVANLDEPGLHLMDTDLAYVVPFGSMESGGRVGASLQLPTGRRDNLSGSGGLDGMVGVAGWKQWGGFRLHGQAEEVIIGLPEHSPYREVLARRSFSRAWAGLGWQGEGPGFWRGLGLDVTLAYSQGIYRTGINRLDNAGWQQHWTITHTSLPRWRFGFSEEAGTYMAPDITAFASRQF